LGTNITFYIHINIDSALNIPLYTQYCIYSKGIADANDKITKDITLDVFLDLSKPFDTIDHDIELYKLCHYGIRDISNRHSRNLCILSLCESGNQLWVQSLLLQKKDNGISPNTIEYHSVSFSTIGPLHAISVGISGTLSGNLSGAARLVISNESRKDTTVNDQCT